MSFLERLAEPSSWASIAAVLVVAGVNIPEPLWQNIVMAGSGLAGVVGFFLKERARD